VTFFIGRLCASVNTGVGRVWTAQGSAMPEMRTPYRLSVTLAVLMLAQALLGLLFQQQYRDDEWITAASLYFLVLSVNSVIAIHRGLAETPGELPMWGSLAILTSAATLLLLVNARTDRSRFAPRRMCNRRSEYTGHR